MVSTLFKNVRHSGDIRVIDPNPGLNVGAVVTGEALGTIVDFQNALIVVVQFGPSDVLFL